MSYEGVLMVDHQARQ